MTDRPSKLASLRREIAEIEARKPLTRAQAIAVLCEQAGGIACGCGCGELLDPLGAGVIDEHLNPLELLGENDLRNRRFFTKACATRKTKTDAANIAKARRLAGETKTGPRKKIPQREKPWPPPGSRKLPTTKFQTSRRER